MGCPIENITLSVVHVMHIEKVTVWVVQIMSCPTGKIIMWVVHVMSHKEGNFMGGPCHVP